MTHVAKEGNRRKGGMTGAEITQSVLDVESWFRKNGGCLDNAEGVHDTDLQALEKAIGASIPEELRKIMSIQDGQLWFSEKKALTCKGMVTEALEMEGRRVPGWRAGLIPFAKDVDDNFLASHGDAAVTDTQAKGCPVADWDTTGVGAMMAKSFSLFLENFRNELLSGRCEYVEGLGVVEKVAKSNASPPRISSNNKNSSSRK
ncbi:unnamed protein product [Pylaiella littoralis]